MRLETGKFLHDILDAAQRITEYTRDKTCHDYLGDSKLRNEIKVDWLRCTCH